MNTKIVSAPYCSHLFPIAEDNLVKLYQGKIEVPVGEKKVARPLERDLVMIYPKEGSIVHNHSAYIVRGPWVSPDQVEAAEQWIAFILESPQQLAMMQEGFRTTKQIPCVDPLGSPFKPCSYTPQAQIYPDQIDPAVAAAIIKSWR